MILRFRTAFSVAHQKLLSSDFGTAKLMFTAYELWTHYNNYAIHFIQ